MAILKIASTFCEPVFEKRIRADINFPSVQVKLDVALSFLLLEDFFSKLPVAFNLFFFTQNKKHSLKCPGRERAVQNPKLVVCLVEFLIYRLQNVFFFLPDRQSVLSDSLEGE